MYGDYNEYLAQMEYEAEMEAMYEAMISAEAEHKAEMEAEYEAMIESEHNQHIKEQDEKIK